MDPGGAQGGKPAASKSEEDTWEMVLERKKKELLRLRLEEKQKELQDLRRQLLQRQLPNASLLQPLQQQQTKPRSSLAAPKPAVSAPRTAVTASKVARPGPSAARTAKASPLARATARSMLGVPVKFGKSLAVRRSRHGNFVLTVRNQKHQAKRVSLTAPKLTLRGTLSLAAKLHAEQLEEKKRQLQDLVARRRALAASAPKPSAAAAVAAAATSPTDSEAAGLEVNPAAA